MNAQEELIKLSNSMAKRRCYTMADVFAGRDADGIDKNMVRRTFDNQFLVAIRKAKGLSSEHTLQKADAGALTELSNLVVDAAEPDAIGRQIARVIDTQKTALKFRKRSLGKARKTSEGTTTDSKGETPNFFTINTDIEIEASEEWTISFLEDAEWDVLQEEAQAVGQAIKIKETEEILSKYAAVANTDLAGGAEQTSAGTGLAYADLVTLWQKVKSENRTPDILFINPLQYAYLLKEDKFINSLYFDGVVNKTTGAVGKSVLGFNIYVSSLVPSAKAYMIDSRYSMIMPIRRDTLVVPYEGNGKTDAGVKATSRFGLGVADTKAIARMAVS